MIPSLNYLYKTDLKKDISFDLIQIPPSVDCFHHSVKIFIAVKIRSWNSWWKCGDISHPLDNFILNQFSVLNPMTVWVTARNEIISTKQIHKLDRKTVSKIRKVLVRGTEKYMEIFLNHKASAQAFYIIEIRKKTHSCLSKKRQISIVSQQDVKLVT